MSFCNVDDLTCERLEGTPIINRKGKRGRLLRQRSQSSLQKRTSLNLYLMGVVSEPKRETKLVTFTSSFCRMASEYLGVSVAVVVT